MKRVVNYHADWHPLDTDAPFCKCGCGQRAKMDNFHNKWKLYAKGHYRKPGPYKDRDWLFAEYITKNRPKSDIAADCGISITTVCKFLKKFGIPFKDNPSYLGRRAGENNPSWRGGVTPERQRLYKQGHWREFTIAVYQRDDYRCVRCNARSTAPRTIHCHHVQSWAEHKELRFDPTNCITLCNKCHNFVHSRANANRDFLA